MIIELKAGDKFRQPRWKHQKHGTVLYKILHILKLNNIRDRNGDRKASTSINIARQLNKYSAYATNLCMYYWEMGYVKRKMIAIKGRKPKKTDKSSFRWEITKKGLERYKYLHQQYGEIIEVEGSQEEDVPLMKCPIVIV